MKTFSKNRLIQLLFFITAFNIGCGSYIQETLVVLDNRVHEKTSYDKNLMPADSTDQIYGGLNKQSSVIRFYKQREFRPAWILNNSISVSGDSLISYIEQIRYFGLMPQDYHKDEINFLKHDSTTSLLRLDALLTDAFLTISKDLKYGRLADFPKANDDANRLAILHKFIINGDSLKIVLSSQEPELSGYKSLKKALKLTLDTLQDEERIGIMNGGLSQKALINKRLQSIEINLERWRWENRSYGDRYIFINIPSFLLEVNINNSTVLESKIIVGAPQTPTLINSSIIDCFIIYPYWDIPKKLAIERYLPLIQSDISFLSKNNFEVIGRKGKLLDPHEIDWSKFDKDNFPVKLRLREDPENFMGEINTLALEGNYSLFQKYSREKSLFEKEIRAFSNGTVQIEKALGLAYYLSTGGIRKQNNLLERYLLGMKRYILDVVNPIPVHVRYFTCEFKGNSFFQYYDVYDKDNKLIDKFYGKRQIINYTHLQTPQY